MSWEWSVYLHHLRLAQPPSAYRHSQKLIPRIKVQSSTSQECNNNFSRRVIDAMQITKPRILYFAYQNEDPKANFSWANRARKRARFSHWGAIEGVQQTLRVALGAEDERVLKHSWTTGNRRTPLSSILPLKWRQRTRSARSVSTCLSASYLSRWLRYRATIQKHQAFEVKRHLLSCLPDETFVFRPAGSSEQKTGCTVNCCPMNITMDVKCDGTSTFGSVLLGHCFGETLLNCFLREFASRTV